MLFIFIVPKIFLLAPVLVVIGVTCLGSSFVLLNSFLPLLVAHHPQLVVGSELASPSSTPESAVQVYEPSVETNGNESSGKSSVGSHPDSAALRLSAQISSKGVGIGYVAAVCVQVLSILLLFLMSKVSVSSTLPLRLVLFMVGLWWLAFTIPSTRWLRDRPGPPLETINNGRSWRSCVAYVAFAWVSLWKTVKVAFGLRQVVVFLVAWFLLSDAIATVSGTAILFARTELEMGTVAIALLSITATGSGIAGAFIWPLISRRFELKTNRTIVACIALMEIIPLYGLLGYVPFIKSWGVGGLQKSFEIYPLGEWWSSDLLS